MDVGTEGECKWTDARRVRGIDLLLGRACQAAWDVDLE